MSANILMLQGGSANSGKSLLAASLCRLLARTGARVTAFKPVLVLNDPVQRAGIVTDQRFGFVLDAISLEQTWQHNPVQITPQKGVFGRALSPAGLTVRGHKAGLIPLLGRDTPLYTELTPDTQKAVESAIVEGLTWLARSHDWVVVEGAGSPIDLGTSDLCNWLVPAHFDARVLLVLRASAGGMEAGAIGTLELLAPEIRRKLAGFLVNDVVDGESIIRAACSRIAARYDVPCLGIIPHLLTEIDALGREAQMDCLADALERHLFVACEDLFARPAGAHSYTRAAG